MCLNLEQKIYVQICALFTLYIQLYRKLCIHIYIVLERVNNLRWGDGIYRQELGLENYRTQVIIPVLLV